MKLEGFSSIFVLMSCFSFCFPDRRNAAYSWTPPRNGMYKEKKYDLAGKTALVTGSSQGLGVHIAHKCAAKGVKNIALIGLGKDQLEEVAASVREKHPGTVVFTKEVDVSDYSQCEQLVQDVLKQFGSCDILVNNAGVNGCIEFSIAGFQRMDNCINVNLKGPIYMARSFLPSMIQAGKGHIVNIGTMSVKRIEPFNTSYMAAKCGVLGWTYGLREEMKHLKTGVTVHLVNPGILSDVGLAMNNPIKSRQAMAEATKVGGSATGAEVADGVIRAIEYDIPETTVNSMPFYWQANEVITRWLQTISQTTVEAGLNQ